MQNSVVLRSATDELFVEVDWVSLGFDRVPPQYALVGDNVALGLRGEGLEVVQDGGSWQVVGECPDAEPGAVADGGA